MAYLELVTETVEEYEAELLELANKSVLEPLVPYTVYGAPEIARVAFLGATVVQLKMATTEIEARDLWAIINKPEFYG